MIKISHIDTDCKLYKKGVRTGDMLISINGFEINDVLDYQFYCTDKKLKIVTQNENGKVKKHTIRKGEYDELGIESETFLMDSQRSCKNKCIFCFIDQMPQGLRDTLYFKDDDARLSFLFGNYVTLTNVTDAEIDRIIKMHISPINISVHTTNPTLRSKMMNNRFAGDALRHMYRLCENGIHINCQLVLVPEYNDGEELVRTLTDLQKLYPCVESVAAVPVGLTRYRQGLEPIKPFDKASASAVIDIIEAHSEKMLKEHGVRLFYPSDEFFTLAGRELPSEDYYGEFLQLENGVGMSALMKSEFLGALESAVQSGAPLAPKHKKVTIPTGKGAHTLISELVAYAKDKCENLQVDVVPIENHFFGPLITATGLITGGDLIKNLENKENLGTLLLSRACLRSEGDLFLDDLTPQDVSGRLKAPIEIIECDGNALFEGLFEIK